MPRLSDGAPDERAEELEETETNPLTDRLAQLIGQGEMEYLGTSDGIAHYKKLKPVVLE